MQYGTRIVALVLAAVACGGGDAGNPLLEPSQRVGIYNLATVDAKPLPYTFPNSPAYELIAETITLNPDNTHIVRSDLRFTDGLGQPHLSVETATGTYTIANFTLTMTHSNGTVVVQTFTGANELTAHCCGNTIWIYRR